MTATVRPIALRPFTELRESGKSGEVPWEDPIWPDRMLVFDTETTTDERQALLFGCWKYYRRRGPVYVPVQEGLFYADELPESDPEGFVCLNEYVRRRRANVETGDPELYLHSQQEFLDRVLWRAGYRNRALIVGFNLPFDLSRVARHVGYARGTFKGGFSLAFWGRYDDEGRWRDLPHRPRLRIKSLNRKSAFFRFTRPKNLTEMDRTPPRWSKPSSSYSYRGRFLDLKTFSFALTSRSHSLASACEAFSVAEGKSEAEEHGTITPVYIDYCRRDVTATGALLHALKEEFDQQDLGLHPWNVFSPASLAKGAMNRMGVESPLEKFDSVPKTRIGQAMSTYAGGRAEMRIRRHPMPVVYADFMSMYPSVNSLLDIWPCVTAERLDLADVTRDVRQLLKDIVLDRCFDPEVWPEFAFFARIEPQGDILPVRTQYDLSRRSRTIGVNPLHGLQDGQTVWATGPDLVASALLTGRFPKLVEAFALLPIGQQKGLRPVKIRGEVEVDPTEDDFFRVLIEERKRVKERDLPEEIRKRLGQALKIIANSGSYGIMAQMDRLWRAEETEINVWTDDGVFVSRTNRPERPGPFCFPPFAALITGGARLMLALLERCVTDLGGTYTFCDTDSMAVVATEEGGLVPCPGGSHELPDGREAIWALSWEQFEEVRERFRRLNPYLKGPAAERSLLELEKENFEDKDPTKQRIQPHFLGVSAKRYALFRYRGDGEIEIVKPSEHGLGHLRNPKDPKSGDEGWMEDVWDFIVRGELGEDVQEPDFFDVPAVSRTNVSSPHLHGALDSLNEGKPYQDQIKPFNFLNSVTLAPWATPPDEKAEKFNLIAPFSTDPDEWLRQIWINSHSGEHYSITTNRRGYAGPAPVKTIGEVVDGYRQHPEAKSLGPDGEPCGMESSGLLHRRPVHFPWVEWIGKESNELEAVEKGLIRDLDEVLEQYVDPDRDPWEDVVLPVLRSMSTKELAEQTPVGRRAVQRILNPSDPLAPSSQVRRVLQNCALRELGRQIESTST